MLPRGTSKRSQPTHLGRNISLRMSFFEPFVLLLNERGDVVNHNTWKHPSKIRPYRLHLPQDKYDFLASSDVKLVFSPRGGRKEERVHVVCVRERGCMRASNPRSCWLVAGPFSRHRLWEGSFEVAGKNSSQQRLWRRLVRKRRVAGSCWGTLVSCTVNTVGRCDAWQITFIRSTSCFVSLAWTLKSKCPEPKGSAAVRRQLSTKKKWIFDRWREAFFEMETLDILDFSTLLSVSLEPIQNLIYSANVDISCLVD